MANPVTTSIARAWNAFLSKGQNVFHIGNASYGNKPYGPFRSSSNERSIIASIYTRIAVDAASIRFNHVRTDEDGQFKEVLPTDLNLCLNVSANIDQTSAAFIQDVVMSLFDEGAIAIVPVDTSTNPEVNNSYDIQSLRVGRIVEWYPQDVKLEVYNDRTGNRQEIIMSKTVAAIVENPFYSVMNEPNSTLKRLISKLNLLDIVDEASGSGKLDLIIQLPYLLKSEARKERARERRAEIEEQLRGSEHGIAYTDGTEKVIQLNRPAENNLLGQIEYLTSMLYSQLGLTEGIMDGSADEKTMINYYRRTVEPVTDAIASSMGKTFITKTGRTQGQKIMTFRNVFSLASVADLTEAADTFTRNEILASNEFRAVLGYKPSRDPKADELRNKNMPVKDEGPEDVRGGKSIDETG